MDSCVCSYTWQPEGGAEDFLLLFVLLLRNWISHRVWGYLGWPDWPAGSGNDLSLPYNVGVAGAYSSARFGGGGGAVLPAH